MRVKNTLRETYTKYCSICGKQFITPYQNKNVCGFDCRAEKQRQHSRIIMRRKRHKDAAKCLPCIICGFDLTTDQHMEDGKIYVLCPNHHALITRNLRTLKELQSMLLS